MGTIFVVSPDYMDALYKESKSYSFDLQGYGSFKEANAGILRTNVSDILGFVILAEELPSEGSLEYQHLLTFIRRCNSLKSNRKFVIASSATISSKLLKLLKSQKNLRVFISSRFDSVTDVVINKNVFGSILLDNYNPYSFKNKEEENWKDYGSPSLRFLPIVNSASTACISKVDKLDTFERTLENDKVFRELSQAKSEMLHFRKYFIAKEFFDDVTSYEKKAEEVLNSMQDDYASWCLCASLKKFIDSSTYTK